MRQFAASVRATYPDETVRRAAAALDAGFTSLALEAPLYDVSWEAMKAAAPATSLLAIRLFLPYPRAVRPGQPGPFRLGATHPEERRDALAQAQATLFTAEKHSIPYVVLPPAAFDVDVEAEQRRRARPGPTTPGPRAAAAGAALDSYRGHLSRLLDLADRYELTLCLTPSARLDEAPDATEAAACLREFRGGPLAVWADVSRWGDGGGLAGDVLGASLRDERDGAEGFLPGDGTRDWKALEEALSAAGIWLLDLRPAAGAEEFERGLTILAERDAELPSN